MTDRNIDLQICKQHEGFYYYRIYDLVEDWWVDEWRLWEDTEGCYHPREEGTTITIRKEDTALHAKMEAEFNQWLEDSELSPWDL